MSTRANSKTIIVDRIPKVVHMSKTWIKPHRYEYRIGNEVFLTLRELKSIYPKHRIVIKNV